ncbi:MAG: hypothetical protein HY544_04555 [Candidatus Diapherotrites archaeon]|uniref:Uncharacterized protein n=1 Tax=Candidatus Iainarchaeum sp. TaxID=3101447 RepID=A0A8T3YP05_9ARCH|nr:hypothetical protein [Candidatus Diapherotrites archaeon]
MQTITIPKQEYIMLKKKASLAEDLFIQLESSLRDAEAGRIREAKH